MRSWLEKYYIVLFFTGLFLIGISNVADYGRPIDEPPEQEILLMNIKEYADYIGIHTTDSKLDQVNKITESAEIDHGIAGYYLFTPILLNCEEDSTALMYAWHVYTFSIWFMGVIALYVILKKLYRHRLTPLLGTLLYFFTPRMYAEGHYNNKDIVFLSFVLIMLAFTVRLIKEQKRRDAIGVAMVSGLLINCKIIGVALWGITGIFVLGFAASLRNTEERKRLLRSLLTIAILTMAVFILLTPAIWRSPADYIHYCLSNSTNFSRWGKAFLFHGEIIKPSTMGVPRTYILQWILMTTPAYISLLFIGSVIIFIIEIKKSLENSAFKNEEEFFIQRFFYALFLISFMLPVCFSIIKGPSIVLYNGWRHNYYLYAYIILCASFAADRLVNYRPPEKAFMNYGRIVISGLLSLCFIITCIDMAVHRSYEYLYYNPIARVVVNTEGFEGDYWNIAELSAIKTFSEQLDYKSSITPIGYAADGQFRNHEIGKLTMQRDHPDSDYFIYNTCMMIDKSELNNYEKVFSFSIYGHEVYGIFQKKQ